MKARGRIDNNQTLIVAGLRANGFSVIILSNQGDGCPDILVGGDRNMELKLTDNLFARATIALNVLMEIKSKTGKQNEVQKKFEKDWKGQYAVVHSLNEALVTMGARRD